MLHPAQVVEPPANLGRFSLACRRFRGTSLSEAIRHAVEAELLRENGKQAVVERLTPFLDDLRAIAGPNRQPIDKSFHDDLWS